MADPDVLQQLLGAEWRGIPFPMGHMDTALSNDLVQHKRPDQVGYHVECTGTNNLIVTATIPFRNNIRPAPSEKWFGRVLYPELYRAFFSACADGSTGPFVHPELGQLNVKCRHMRSRFDSSRRDGIDVDVEWEQSLDDGEFIGAISQPSPVAVATSLATQLDEQVSELVPPPPEMQEDPISFEEMMRSLQAIPDTATLLSHQVAGMFNRITAKIDRLEDAMARFNTVRYWPIVDAIEHMRATVFDMQRKFAVDEKVIREYLVLSPLTLTAIAQILKQNIDDMIRLNRNLIEDPVIDRGTRVKYYKLVA